MKNPPDFLYKSAFFSNWKTFGNEKSKKDSKMIARVYFIYYGIKDNTAIMEVYSVPFLEDSDSKNTKDKKYKYTALDKAWIEFKKKFEERNKKYISFAPSLNIPKDLRGIIEKI